ncbi:hypothetical protein FA13DRAFT_63250 [Coprinellus micaceus]|uniref:DUF6534 domain-containing protein n=1 Tax=Coprinellus micaceus TaxID=71717 RepID=A0A4Y7TIQ9_COPMI|nr:hypothetical protein FA13DRAFT_63250 [Coprinellus micaceus]
MGAFDTSIGALLLGAFFSVYLYGLSAYQFGSYWNTDFNDPLWLKASVILLFFLDTTHAASASYLAWVILVDNIANPGILSKVIWPYPASMILICIIAFGVQNFLVMRIYRLTGHRWVLGIFFFCTTATMVFGFVYGAKVARLETLMEMLTLKAPLTLWLAFEVVLDTSISAVLLTAIQRSRTGFRRSDAVLNRLARSAIQSGVFTSVLATLSLVCFLALSDTMFYATFGWPCARAYTISLMDTLLCRKELRVLMNSDTKDGFGMTSVPSLFTRRLRGVAASTPPGTLQMYIRTEVETEVHYTKTRS